MSDRVLRRFFRGLVAAALPPIVDYLVVYLGSDPLFGMYTPLVTALLLALDKMLRDMHIAASEDGDAAG